MYFGSGLRPNRNDLREGLAAGEGSAAANPAVATDGYATAERRPRWAQIRMLHMLSQNQAREPGAAMRRRSTLRPLISICLGLIVMAYTLGVVFGYIPDGQKIDLVHLGLITLTALLIVLLLWPEAISRVKLVEVPGIKFEMLELREKQAQQSLQLEDMKLIIPLLLPEPERKHLLNLARNPRAPYKRSRVTQDELRHLRSLGLIKMKPMSTVGELPDDFKLEDHFEFTDRGKRWVTRYGELEGI
jgi:hypothetical protein